MHYELIARTTATRVRHSPTGCPRVRRPRHRPGPARATPFTLALLAAPTAPSYIAAALLSEHGRVRDLGVFPACFVSPPITPMTLALPGDGSTRLRNGPPLVSRGVLRRSPLRGYTTTAAGRFLTGSTRRPGRPGHRVKSGGYEQGQLNTPQSRTRPCWQQRRRTVQRAGAAAKSSSVKGVARAGPGAVGRVCELDGPAWGNDPVPVLPAITRIHVG